MFRGLMVVLMGTALCLFVTAMIWLGGGSVAIAQQAQPAGPAGSETKTQPGKPPTSQAKEQTPPGDLKALTRAAVTGAGLGAATMRGWASAG